MLDRCISDGCGRKRGFDAGRSPVTRPRLLWVRQLAKSPVRLDEDLLDDVLLVESIGNSLQPCGRSLLDGARWTRRMPRRVYHTCSLLRPRAAQGKHLHASGTRPFLWEYASSYRHARSPRAKMILIDSLIHRLHWELEGRGGAPAARDLIGAKTEDIWPSWINWLTAPIARPRCWPIGRHGRRSCENGTSAAQRHNERRQMLQESAARTAKRRAYRNELLSARRSSDASDR